MTSSIEKPSVLIITRNLPPLVGGMERLVQQLTLGVCEWAEVTVIGPHGCATCFPEEVSVIEVSEQPARFLFTSTLSALKATRQRKFDAVVGGSGLVAPILLLLSIFRRLKTAVLLHGLDLVVDNRIYQHLFVTCIRKVDLVIANSANTRTLAFGKGVSRDKVVVINPGTTLPIPCDTATLADFRERYDLAPGPVILFVGRMTRRKGLSGFIRNCLPAIIAAVPNTTLLVVGKDPAHSLNREGEEREVIQAAQESGLGGRIRFLGQVDDEQLTQCYALATVQILPLVEVAGDVEGFGMIAVEAAACGTPTVAFELGGVPDAISASSGALVAPGDYPSFAQSVLEVLRSDYPSAESCREHARQFAWPRYNAQVEESLRALLAVNSGTGR